MAQWTQKFKYLTGVLTDFKSNATLSSLYTISNYNIYSYNWIDPTKTYDYETYQGDSSKIPTTIKYYAIPTVYDAKTETYTEQDELYSVSVDPSITVGDEVDVTTIVKTVYWIDDSYDPTLPSLNKLKLGKQIYNVKDTFARNKINEIESGEGLSIKADKVIFENSTGYDVGNNVDSALEALINKVFYVAIACSLTGTGNKSNYIGETVTAPTLTWTSTKIPISATLTDCTITDIDRLAQTGTYTTTSDITNNKTFTLSVSDGTKSSSTSITYNFYYPYYYGTVESNDVSKIDISILDKEKDTSANETATFTASGEYLVFITNRTLKSIMDQNNFENFDDFEKKSITITLGTTEYTLNCYITSTVKTCTSFKYTFKA